MPILLNVLGSSDQKVVEQGSLCVSGIVDSFKYQQDKLEELISTSHLAAILRLLLPGTTNLIGPNIQTQFLRVLAITARASPSLSTELFKLDVVDTLYQILTGVSPPSGTEDVASKIDGVVIMQALIHRPREQIYEALNVICELLPGVSTDGLALQGDFMETGRVGDELVKVVSSKFKKTPNAKRIDLLKGCQQQLKRFAIILLPTLTHAYSSTVNLSVRQKVLTAQLKMLSNLDTSILEVALRTVPYASYLASILSQQDHPALVTYALQAAELLIVRLENIYRYQFYREGVISEISMLASQPGKAIAERSRTTKVEPSSEVVAQLVRPSVKADPQEPQAEKDRLSENAKDVQGEKSEDDQDDEDDDGENDDDDGDDDDDDGEDDEESHDIQDEISASPSTSSSSDRNYSAPSQSNSLQNSIILRAKRFLDAHETAKGKDLREKATAILCDVQDLAKRIQEYYVDEHSTDGIHLFSKLSSYFSADALESITSAELLSSNIVDVLLAVFGNANGLFPYPKRAQDIADMMQW